MEQPDHRTGTLVCPCSVTGCTGSELRAGPSLRFGGHPDFSLCAVHKDFLLSTDRTYAVYCASCGKIAHFIMMRRPALTDSIEERILFEQACSQCGGDALPQTLTTHDGYRAMRKTMGGRKKKSPGKNGTHFPASDANGTEVTPIDGDTR